MGTRRSRGIGDRLAALLRIDLDLAVPVGLIVVCLGVAGVLALRPDPAPVDVRTAECTIADKLTATDSYGAVSRWVETVECGRLSGPIELQDALSTGRRYALTLGEARTRAGLPAGTVVVAVNGELPTSPSDARAAADRADDVQADRRAWERIAVMMVVVSIAAIVLTFAIALVREAAGRRGR